MQEDTGIYSKGALSIAEFCAWASIGRTLAYEQIKNRRLSCFKVGRRTLILCSEAERWLHSVSHASDPDYVATNDKPPHTNKPQ
jgi:hypothetical protein